MLVGVGQFTQSRREYLAGLAYQGGRDCQPHVGRGGVHNSGGQLFCGNLDHPCHISPEIANDRVVDALERLYVQ